MSAAAGCSNAKLLGACSVPRHARKVAADRRVRFDRLCASNGLNKDWCWSSDAPAACGGGASCVVNIDTGSCTPAILTCASAAEPSLLLLRFRLPRSTWDAWRADVGCGGGVFLRRLDADESRWLLHAVEPMDFTAKAVLHPHLASMIVGTRQAAVKAASLCAAATDAWADAQQRPRLLLVAVPPQPSATEQCFTLLTHPSSYADAENSSDTEADVPILQRIHRHGLWDARSEAASSNEIAKMFNDALPVVEALVHSGGAPLSLKGVFAEAVTDIRAGQKQAQRCWQRYCTAHPLATTPAGAAPPAPPRPSAPPAPQRPPTAGAAAAAGAGRTDLVPSDEDDEVCVARDTVRKRAATNDDPKKKKCAKPAAATAKKPRRASKRASDSDSSDSDDEDDESDSSSVTKESEEDEDEEDDDSEIATVASCGTAAAAAAAAAASWQEPCHRSVARRMQCVLAKHADHFPDLRVKDAQRACDALLQTQNASGVEGARARAEAYNELLGVAVSCLEDLVEERRPDRCVLIPRDEATAMRNSWRRCHAHLCETAVPQLDAAIAKLTALRDAPLARAALLLSAAASAPAEPGSVVDHPAATTPRRSPSPS